MAALGVSFLQLLLRRVWVILSGILRVVWGDKMLLGALTEPLMFGSLCCTHCSTVSTQSMLFFPLWAWVWGCVGKKNLRRYQCFCKCTQDLNLQEKKKRFLVFIPLFQIKVKVFAWFWMLFLTLCLQDLFFWSLVLTLLHRLHTTNSPLISRT